MANEYDEDFDNESDEIPEYPAVDDIDWNAFRHALASLGLFDDMFLTMQANNLAMVDQFISGIEQEVLEEDIEGRDFGRLMFLNAQTQMWIFSAYELLRTWRARVKEAIKLHENGGLKLRIDALRLEKGFIHTNKLSRADQLERVLKDRVVVDRLREDLRLTHTLFGQIEFLRVSMAKHEVSGKAKSVAFSPGYGRVNMWTGSLDYQLESGQVILGTLNRRQIADGIRAFVDRSEIPDENAIAAFDEFMKAGDVPDAVRDILEKGLSTTA